MAIFKIILDEKDNRREIPERNHGLTIARI